MSYHTYTRKLSKLKALVKKLYATNRFSTQFQKLTAKIQQLVNDLKRTMSVKELTKVLGAASMFIALSTTNVTAQQFDTPVANGFGMGIGSQYFFVPVLADMDGDGDIDLLACDLPGESIIYQRNSGSPTNPVFDAPIVNPFGLVDTTVWIFPSVGDLDNDGDLDVLIGEYSDSTNSRFAYFQNIGTPTNPNFAAPQINPFGITNAYDASTPNLADIDGDGDLDLFSSTAHKIQFYQNTGTPTTPNFTAPVDNPYGIFIPPSTYYIYTFDLVDLDKDGDLDLLSTDYYGAFMYFQNTGTATNPNFAAPAFNPFNLAPPSSPGSDVLGFPDAADLDGDGDYDIVLGQYDNYNYISLFYYENIMGSTNNENQLPEVELEVFPNPASSYLSITTDVDQEVNVMIYDQKGRLLLTENKVLVTDGYTVKVDQFPQGTYLLKLEQDGALVASKQFVVVKD